MSSRARRRRARAEALPQPVAARRPGLRLPLLPLVAGLAALAVLGAAWRTSWAPGPAQPDAAESRFTVTLSPEQQRVINSWERFFICFDLLDPNVIERSLQANQRATGSLDFPGEQVEVALPAAGAGEERAPPPSGAEEELIAVRRSILEAAVPARLAAVRQQCAGAGGR